MQGFRSIIDIKNVPSFRLVILWPSLLVVNVDPNAAGKSTFPFVSI